MGAGEGGEFRPAITDLHSVSPWDIWTVQDVFANGYSRVGISSAKVPRRDFQDVSLDQLMVDYPEGTIVRETQGGIDVPMTEYRRTGGSFPKGTSIHMGAGRIVP